MSDFDDMFRKGLYDHEVDVPDDLWSRIDQEVNPKKKYTKLYLGLLVGIIVCCAVSYSYFYMGNHNQASIDTAADSFMINATEESHDALRSLLIASTESLENDNLASKNSKIDQSNRSRVDLPRIQVDNKRPVTVLENTKSVSKIVIQDEMSTNTNKYSQESNVASINAQEAIDIERFQKTASEISLKRFEIADLHARKVNEYTISLMPEYDKKCPKFGNSKTGFFSVEAYHSSDRNFKNLVAKSEEDEDYVESRSQSESNRYSFSNGIGVTWHHIQGIGIGMGIERTQINELFSYVQQDAREVRVLITLDTLFNTDGTFTTSIDTTRIEVLGVKKSYISNNYVSYDLPISLSYRWDRKRWSVGVRGAVYLNLLFNPKGRILGINGKPVWITEGSENELDAYRSKSGLKFDGSIDVACHITDKWDVYVQPFFRYNGNTYTRDNYQLDHFINTVGIRTGIRYNFGF